MTDEPAVGDSEPAAARRKARCIRRCIADHGSVRRGFAMVNTLGSELDYPFTRHWFPSTPGESRIAVYYCASPAGVLRSAALNGSPLGTNIGYEQGHPVIGIGLTLSVGKTDVVTLQFDEPAGTGAPTLRMQPTVNPVQATVTDDPCGS